MEIRVLRRLEEKNQATADEIRALLGKHHVRMVNIMGGPGCGKTTLLEHLLPKLSQRLRCAVLEGDLFTTRDAERIAGRMRDVILSAEGAKIDYVALVDPETLEPVDQIVQTTLAAVAVRIDNTRLIDNHLLEPPPSRGAGEELAIGPSNLK